MTPLPPDADRRCFLWHASGEPAGMYVMPPSMASYPTAIVILTPERTVRYRQDPADAHMYREAA